MVCAGRLDQCELASLPARIGRGISIGERVPAVSMARIQSGDATPIAASAPTMGQSARCSRASRSGAGTSAVLKFDSP